LCQGCRNQVPHDGKARAGGFIQPAPTSILHENMLYITKQNATASQRISRLFHVLNWRNRCVKAVWREVNSLLDPLNLIVRMNQYLLKRNEPDVSLLP
jgi:hypothetical protein